MTSAAPETTIAFSCLLAVASAGYLNHAAPLGYANHGSHAVAYNAPLVSAPHPVHVGYAGPLAHAYAAHTGPVAHGYAHAAPIAHGYAHGYAHAGLASEARLIDPVAIAAGAPLPGGDTVEVAAAKAFHHQAHVEAKTGHLLSKSLAYSAPIAHGYAHAAPIAVAHSGSHAVAYNAPLVSAPHPVHVAYSGPLAHAYAANTGPVAHGYAQGYAHASPVAHGYAHGYAHASPVAHGYAHGYAHAAPIAHGYAHAGLVSEARLIDPVAIAAGAPLPTGDTVEVAAAKAFHAQAHHAAKAGHYLAKRSPGYLNAGVVAAPLAYAAPAHSYSYSSQITHAAPVHSYVQSYAAPVHSYGVSTYAAPHAYAGHSGYGYGGHLGSYYG